MVHPRLRHLSRTVRLGLPVVAVLSLALAGCGDGVEPAPAATPPAPSSSPPSSAPSTASGVVPRTASDAGSGGSTGSDGLTVRHLGDDGRVQTVPVEDFPHPR